MTSKTQKSVGLKHGFRSGLEENEAQALGDRGIPFRFECFKIPYRIERDAKYTPDFLLLNQGIVLETKGRFTSADRQKHKMIKKQHPDLDIRFVFSNAKTRISKQSSTTYADWCEKNGFLWAHKTTPEKWLLEEPNEKSIQILRSLGVSI